MGWIGWGWGWADGDWDERCRDEWDICLMANGVWSWALLHRPSAYHECGWTLREPSKKRCWTYTHGKR